MLLAAVIAAYILIWPRANIRVFYWFFIFIGTISVPAFVVLGLWFVEQIVALYHYAREDFTSEIRMM